MRNRTGQFPQHFLLLKVVHFIVLPADLIRDAALPRLDFVEMFFNLIVTALTDINLYVANPLRPAAGVPSKEHDEALPNDLVNVVVPILSSFYDFVLIESAIDPVHSLFWPIIPAGVYELLALCVLPSAEDLGNCRFRI